MKRWHIVLGGCVIAALLVISGTMDATAQQQAEQRYIDNVCDNVHSNYKGWDIACKDHDYE